MSKVFAFLRAINVSGRTVTMAALKAEFEGATWRNRTTVMKLVEKYKLM